MKAPTASDGNLCPWVAANLPACTLPEWVRTTLVGADGVLYVPAAIAPGGEIAVTLSSMHDRMSPVRFKGHAFVSMRWLRDEYPRRHDLLELLDLIERRIVAAIDEASGGTQAATSPAAEEPWHE